MAKDDKEYEYITALQDFSKSLKYLVDAIKNQVENKKNDFKGSIGETKDMAASLAEMGEQLVLISETTTTTQNNTEEILEIVKGIKNEKKSGIWAKLDNAKDKTKSVAEGIKTIALMAGGILAIGLAFKVIGDVDFKSVIALSIALPLMAIAFDKIGETVRSPKESALIALSMVFMSVGVAISGAILSLMPTLSLGQMFSAIAVSATMGIVMYALSLATDNLSYTEIIGLAAMSLVMPAIAWGIVKSAEILSGIPDIEVIKTIKGALAVAISGIVMAGGIWVIDKLGLGLGTVIKGTIALTIMSAGLMASSHLLSMGNYSNGPSLDWSLGVGAIMIASLIPVLALGIVAATGVGAIVIAAGIISMIAVAGGLAEVSHIIKQGDFSGGPTKEWAEGVGLSLVYFANALDFLKPGIFSNDTLGDNIKAMILMGKALPAIGIAVGKDTSIYSGGPRKPWADGVGGAIVSFANAIAILADEGVDATELLEWIPSVVMLGKLSVGLANLFKTADFSNYPSVEWVKGVSSFMENFSKLDMIDNADDTHKQIMTLSRAYIILAKSLGVLGKSMQGLQNVPDMSGVYGGIVTLSLVDTINFEKTLDILNTKKDQFQNVLSMLQAKSDVKIDDSTFAFNKDKSNNSENNTQSTNTISSTNSNLPVVKTNTTKTTQPKENKQESLLNNLVQLMSQMNGILGEIADNTAQGISNTNIIAN